MKDFEMLKKKVMARLEQELDPLLTYHSARHTRDVLVATEQLSRDEHVSEEEVHLLKVAALLHDAGFLLSFEEHEAFGAKLARQILPSEGYSSNEIETVCRLIMATRVPQAPKDLLEYIICDADLDYLGRNDFFEVGDRLYQEFKARGIVSDMCDWDRLQIKFLEYHKYFTTSARLRRTRQKAKHLELVRTRLGECSPKS